MVLSKRCLFSSSLILLKIVRVITKGMYYIVLKILREIEFTLKGDENPALLQNVRFRSKINPSNNRHLVSDFDANPSTAVNFLIRNLPTGRKVTVKHLNGYEVETHFSEVICEKSNDFYMGRGIVKQTSHPVCLKLDDAFPSEENAQRIPLDCSLPLDDISAVSQDRKHLQAIDDESLPESSVSAKESSRSKIFVNDSDESSCSQINTFHQNIKLNKRTYSKNKISESNLSKVAKHINKDTKELKHFTKESIDVASLSKSGGNVYPDEKQAFENSENQYFEDQESDFDLNTVVKQNKIDRKYIETDLLDQSEISYTKEENNSKNVENHSVRETNKEEVKLNFPKDSGSLASCFKTKNDDDTMKSSHSFENGFLIFKFKTSKFRLQYNQVTNYGVGNTDTKKSSDKCEKKIPNQKLQGDRVDTSREPNIEERQDHPETVTKKRSTVSEDKGEMLKEEVCELQVDEEDAEKLLENMQHGENFTTNQLPPSTSESYCLESQKQAFLNFLEELQPMIRKIEDKIISMCQVIIYNSLTSEDDINAIHSLLEKIVQKSRVLNSEAYEELISDYAKLMYFLLVRIQKDIDSNKNLNQIEFTNYVGVIEYKLQELKNLLYSAFEPTNSSSNAELTAETKVSRKNKKTKKKKRRR